MNRYLLLTLFVIFGTYSCNTIEIAEKDVFDVKRTIYPEDFKETPYLLERRSFRSGNYMLRAWWITQPDARGTVLYYGGNGFVKETGYHIIFSILRQRMNLLVFNYRGYGRNPGKPSVKGLKTDGMNAYRFLRDSLKIPPEKLVIHGHSLGTFVAAYVATRREATGLVLQSPLTNAEDMIKAVVPALLRPLIRFEVDEALKKEDNLKEIQQVDVPLLVACGTDDQITPMAMAKKLYKNAQMEDKTLKLIKGGSHNDLNQRETYQQALQKHYWHSLGQ